MVDDFTHYVIFLGWIALKFKTTHPSMGKYSYKEKENEKVDHCYYKTIPVSWVRFLSFGGLMVPSDEWMKQAKILEHLFQKNFQPEMNGLVSNITVSILKEYNGSGCENSSDLC